MAEAPSASWCTPMCHYGRLKDGKQRKAVAQEEEAVGVKARCASRFLKKSQFVTGCPAGYFLVQAHKNVMI